MLFRLLSITLLAALSANAAAWIGIATNIEGDWGVAINYLSKGRAQDAALLSCGSHNRRNKCKLILIDSVLGYHVIATHSNAVAWGWDQYDLENAKNIAIKKCQKSSGSKDVCEVVWYGYEGDEPVRSSNPRDADHYYREAESGVRRTPVCREEFDGFQSDQNASIGPINNKPKYKTVCN